MTPPLLAGPPGGRQLDEAEMGRREQSKGRNGGSHHQLEVFPPSRWVSGAADVFQEAIADSIGSRGECVLGLSGGSTPAPVFAELAGRPIDWSKVTVVQVDERLAAIDSGDRNLVQLQAAFAGLPVRWLPFPVETTDSEHSIESFLDELEAQAGSPAVLDVVHLGLGSDGHTASLVPGDPILEVVDRDVAMSGVYQGRRRLSMTRPLLDRARLVLWLVAGEGKAAALQQLLDGDRSIPASLLSPARSLVIADSPALLSSPA